jgi:hypothetical protein
MTSDRRRRRICATLGAVACVAAAASCSRLQDPAWYGYYYENVMINNAPAVSRPFPSARACLAAMHAYTRNASRWSGFACARGCQQQNSGILTDCAEVVH